MGKRETAEKEQTDTAMVPVKTRSKRSLRKQTGKSGRRGRQKLHDVLWKELLRTARRLGRIVRGRMKNPKKRGGGRARWDVTRKGRKNNNVMCEIKRCDLAKYKIEKIPVIL